MKKIVIIMLFIFLGISLSYSQKIVKGKVMDLYSNPISGVNVRVEGTDIKTKTDKDGFYQINANCKKDVLVFEKEKLMKDHIKLEGRKIYDIVLIPKPKEVK